MLQEGKEGEGYLEGGRVEREGWVMEGREEEKAGRWEAW